jgi:DNA polymerase I-like protein with 3'-5' exonuclease and polymerase domains
MNYQTEIVTSCSRFDLLVTNAPAEVVADVENRGEWPQSPVATLLGVAIAFRLNGEIAAFYVAFSEWDAGSQSLRPVGEVGLPDRVSTFLASRKLVGHNIEHDRQWLDACLGIKTEWVMDTRLAWQMSDHLDSRHGFGLKTAQVELLGWETDNEGPLTEAIKAAGGKGKADIYLAPLGVLGRYSALDAVSTLLLKEKLTPFYDRFNYWEFLQRRMAYHPILTEATSIGTPVDVEVLLDAKEELDLRCSQLKKEIRNVCKMEVEELENQWAYSEAMTRKTEAGRTKYLDDPDKWITFNPNSPHHRSELFHDTLGIPILERTPTGRPKQDRATIASINHPVAKAFVEYSEVADTLEKANTYLSCLRLNNTIHFPYDYAATVSGRLGGFKPYALNMPFSETKLMSAFKIPEGMIGIHADLSAIEPCLTGAFSGDPTLLKVHQEGLGDIYLDFGLDAFPDNLELKQAYNPLMPKHLLGPVKKQFSELRDLCKILHLAVGYTGTAYTVAKNMRKKGHQITDAQTKQLVNRYWAKFEKIADFDFKLRKIYSRQGHVRNLFGRILQVPENYRKDTMNRFIQSGGHDVLVEWVMGINARRLPGMYPILPDIHDSTSWAVNEGDFEKAKAIYEDSLREINSRLNLPVTIRAEIKPFRTFAGLKGNEQ